MSRRLRRAAGVVRAVPRPLPGAVPWGELRRRRLHLDLRAEHRLARPGPTGQGGVPEHHDRRSAARTGRARWARSCTGSFPFVDFVCSGEADESLPRASSQALGADGGPGAASRASSAATAGATRRDRPAPPDPRPRRAADPRLRRLLPRRSGPARAAARPAADAARRDLARLLVGGEVALHVLRAERRRDGVPQQERRSRPRRAATLRERYGVDRFERRRQHPRHELLPHAPARCSRGAARAAALLRGQGEPVARQVAPARRRAGVDHVQPGIESLSDHVLKLCARARRAPEHPAAQVVPRARRRAVEWNLLYGFPGEAAADYERDARRARRIRFLDPPSGSGRSASTGSARTTTTRPRSG